MNQTMKFLLTTCTLFALSFSSFAADKPQLDAMKKEALALEAQARKLNTKDASKEDKDAAKKLVNQARVLKGKAKAFESADKIDEMVGKMVAVKPKAERKILIYSRTTGFRHGSIEMGAAALQALGTGTGAFTADHSEDPSVMTDENLAQYDGIMMLNTTGAPVDKKGEAAFEKFVASGKGIMGLHAATDCHRDWAGYRNVMGGIFDGHPWNAGSLVTLYNEDTEHPVSKNVPQGFQIKDEIYQYKDDEYFTRDKLRILLSLDLNGEGMKKGGMKRADNDYPVSWVRMAGPTRVFYSNLGHNDGTFLDPVAMQHILAGIQFAVGDIEADTTPSAKLGKLPKAVE